MYLTTCTRFWQMVSIETNKGNSQSKREAEHTRAVSARWMIWLTVQLLWSAGIVSVMSSNSTHTKFLYQLLIYNLLYQRRSSVMIIVYITLFLLNTSDYLCKIMRSGWLITTKGNCPNLWHRATVCRGTAETVKPAQMITSDDHWSKTTNVESTQESFNAITPV